MKTISLSIRPFYASLSRICSSTMKDAPQPHVHGRSRAAAEKIRAQITSGRYPAGAQLPTFDALVEQHGLSRATMQAVIRQLRQDGFVRSVHRSGLFVSEMPPHLCRFGLVFSDTPGGPTWNRFMGALLAEAPVVAAAQGGVQLVPYFGVSPGVRNEAHERLLADVANQRLAGVVVTRGAGFLLSDPAIRAQRVPCVAINHLVEEADGVPVVNTDDPLLLQKALDWLAERGRKRVAVIAMRPSHEVSVETCAAAGLKTRSHWLCPIGQDASGQVRAVVQLLLDYPVKERPDCLVIATDNFVEEALSGIHATGIVIGRDVDVVAHCNWPWPVESPLPITRVGFHSHHFLNHCLEAIRQQRRGEKPATCTLVPALFEHEL